VPVCLQNEGVLIPAYAYMIGIPMIAKNIVGPTTFSLNKKTGYFSYITLRHAKSLLTHCLYQNSLGILLLTTVRAICDRILS
jgi:hypothetical protein